MKNFKKVQSKPMIYFMALFILGLTENPEVKKNVWIPALS